jgi:hypothetical protein
MNILGRYLRQMYHYLVSDVRNLDVSDGAFEVLVGMYSVAGAGGELDLAPMLGLEEDELDGHLESLHDDGLIENVEPPHDLTPQAQFLINERFEDVNF